MVIPRIALPLLLLAACGDRTAIPGSADAAPDTTAPDAGPVGPRFGPETTWRACQVMGMVDSVFSLAVSPDGRYLAAGSSDSSIWNLKTGELVRTIGTDGGMQYGFSRDGALLAMTGDGRFVFRVADGQRIFLVSDRPSSCIDWSSAGAISPDDRQLAIGSCGFLQIHDLDGRAVARIASHAFAPGVAYSPDGRLLATSGPELHSANGDERFWPARVIPAPRPPGGSDLYEALRDNTVAFSPDGTLLLVSNTIDMPRTGQPWTASTQLLRVADGGMVHDFGTALSRHPSFSPDGAWVVAGEQLVYLATYTYAPLAADLVVSTFLPDGRIAAQGKDHVVRLYCPN